MCTHADKDKHLQFGLRLSTSLLTLWEQRRLWTVCTYAAIDKHLQFGLRLHLHPYSLYGSDTTLDSVHTCRQNQTSTIGLRLYLQTYSLYGSREGFGQCAPMHTLTNIYNLVLNLIYIHTHCMGAEKALERLHTCRHRQISTIWSETSSTSICEQRRLWT